jgi:hypothetical protein
MTTQTLRGRTNQIIGYLNNKEEEIILRDSHNEIVGRFNKAQGRAYSQSGQIIGNSPQVLMTLLSEG